MINHQQCLHYSYSYITCSFGRPVIFPSLQAGVTAQHLRSTTALALCKEDIYPTSIMLCHTKRENYGNPANIRKELETVWNHNCK